MHETISIIVLIISMDEGDDKTAARELWNAGKPSGDGSVLPAAQAGKLLAKSGLEKAILRKIWNKAKAGSISKVEMNEIEFLKAYEYVLEAGGTFQPKTSSKEPPIQLPELELDNSNIGASAPTDVSNV